MVANSEVREVKIESLKHAYHIRRKVDDDWVFHLATLFEADVDLPPIDVTENYEIIDGRQRVQAALLAGLTRIKVRVHRGLGELEIFKMGCSANGTGPRPMTRTDFILSARGMMERGAEEGEILKALQPIPREYGRQICAAARKEYRGLQVSHALSDMALGLSLVEVATKRNIKVSSLKAALALRGKKHNLSRAKQLHKRVAALINRTRAAWRKIAESIGNDLQEAAISRDEAEWLLERAANLPEVMGHTVQDSKVRILN